MWLKAISLVLASSLALGGCTSTMQATRGFYGRSASMKPAEAQAFSDFLVARYASMTDDPDVAAEKYAAAIQSAPQKSGIAERAVYSALLSGDFEAALALAHQADEVGSNASLVRLTLGIEAMQDKRSREVQLYLNDTRYSPFNALIAQGLYSWYLFERRGADTAETYLRDTLTGEPALDSVPLYTLALIQLSAGKKDEALETFEQLWQAGGRVAVGVEAHAALMASSGDRDRALGLLSAFETEIGVNAGLDRLKQDILAGRPIAAPRLGYEQGAALAVYVPAAVLLGRGADDDTSGVYFSLALALDPDRHVARSLWAQSLIASGRTDDAIGVLSGIPASSPFYPASLGQTAWALHTAGHDAEALQLARKAERTGPDTSLALQLAQLYQALGNYDGAEVLLTKAITAEAALGDADWRMLFARGIVRNVRGDWAAAERDLLEAYRINPSDPALLNYLGAVYVERGEHLERGVRMIETAVALNPGTSIFIDSLGWAYFTLGRYEDAIVWLERAVELDPANPLLNDHLGDGYWQVGRKTEARYQWQRVLKLSPERGDAALLEAKMLRGPVVVETRHAETGMPQPAPNITQP